MIRGKTNKSLIRGKTLNKIKWLSKQKYART